MPAPCGHTNYRTPEAQHRARRDHAQAEAIILAAKALAQYVEQHAPRYELPRGQLLGCIANLAADELRAAHAK